MSDEKHKPWCSEQARKINGGCVCKSESSFAAPTISSDLLATVVRKHYRLIDDPKGCDGAQMWGGKWWMPLWGCDTLENMLTDMAHAITHKKE